MNLLDLARDKGLNPKRVSSTNGGEYHSSCPVCGGKDRFVMQPHFKAKNCEGTYFCRQCDAGGDSIQFCREFLGKDFLSAMEYLGLPPPEKSFIPDWRNKSEPETLKPPNKAWLARAEEIVQLGEHYIQKAPAILEMLALVRSFVFLFIVPRVYFFMIGNNTVELAFLLSVFVFPKDDS